MTKPEQVKQVEKALIENGKRAGLPRQLACYTSRDGDDWIVGPNFEGPDSQVYRDGKWYVRRRHSGEDFELTNGFREALANASIAYTG